MPRRIPYSLHGKKILITLGATREYLDPVRFMTNASSGKMGLALAAQCRKKGADVYLIAGATIDIAGYPGENIVSASDLLRSAKKKFSWADVLIACAAVSDYKFSKTSRKKMKRGAKSLSVQMIPNPDVLATLTQHKRNQICVGFALEDRHGLRNGAEKMARKRCDLMVLNSPAAMESEKIDATLLFKNGAVQPLGPLSKISCAEKICAALSQCLNSSQK